MGSFANTLANFNPNAVAQAYEQRQADLARTQAGTQQVQQQTQGLQLEQEIQRRMLRDQDIGQRAYVNTDWSKPSAEQDAEEYMIRNGMTLKGIMDYRMATATYRRTLAGAQKDDLENQQTVNGMKADAFNAYLNAKPEDKPTVWPTVADRLNRFGANYDRNTAPPDQLLQAGLALNEHQSVLLENQLKQKQTEEAATRAAGEKQTQELKAAEEKRQETARQALPPTATSEQRAMTAEQRSQETLKQQELEVRRKELERQTAQFKANMDMRNKQYNLEFERAQRQAEQFELMMRPSTDPGSPEYGVAPGDIKVARAAKTKSELSYNNAVNAARDLQDFITEAREGGSKAAYSMLPAEGSFVLSSSRGSRRINRNEVEAWAHAGNLLDRIKGTGGKIISGASIDDDVLNSFQALHAGIAANALKQHQDNLRTIDNTYNTHYATQQPAGGGGGGHRVQWTRDAQGRPVQVTNAPGR